MISFDNLKSVAKVLQEAGKIEQYTQILEVQQKLLEMQAKIIDLEKDNKKLKDRLNIKDSLEYANNCYWIKKKDIKEGPFCSRCWDKEKLLIRMHPQGNKAYTKCPACDTSVQVSEDTSSAIVHRNRAHDINLY
jgi:hypothetical protein